MLALSLAGCTINILPAATLQGSVEFEGGDPAVNAKVTLTPASAAGTSWVTYTDAAGNWTTGRKIRPESYTIKFEHTDADESVTINFVVALPFKTYTVPLQTLPFTEGGTTGLNVSGTVIWDHDANPLTAMVPLLGASVEVDGAVTKSAYTDSTGTWKVNNVPAGEYDITATKDGWADGVLLNVDVEGAATFVAPQIVMVQDKVDLEGNVTDDSLVPVALQNASITLTPIYGAYTVLYATTNVSGDWSISNAKAGLYTLKVEMPGYVTQSRDFNAMDSTAVTITASPVKLPAVVVPGAAGAYGNVAWDHDANPATAREPLVDVKVSFIPEGGDLPIQIVFTNGLGEWLVDNLPFGAYTVTFEKFGMATVELSLNAVVSSPDYSMGEVFMIPGLTTDPVAVSGKVYDELAAPLYDVKVVFAPQFAWGYTRTTYTNEEGSFNIPSMIAGMYKMHFEKNGYASSGEYDVDISVGGVDYNLGTFEYQLIP